MAHHPRHFLGGLVKKATMALSGQEFTTWSDIAVLRELTLHRYAFQWCFSILLLRDAAGAGRGRVVPQIIVEPAVRLNEDRSAGNAGVPCGHRKDDT